MKKSFNESRSVVDASLKPLRRQKGVQDRKELGGITVR